ncbi:histone-lysine N-methyltransferase SETMAR-like [Harpegnathos saltator]|uniref:histone-lysine N-methyltransferase SETMAR-like n=1 Tax=Harpegnathos saltator TaxID=610380 RepID=UPI000DBED95D|nr:histone-lysine N-methyltransferase SETMAR-like [Harpegnathos saltator]
MAYVSRHDVWMPYQLNEATLTKRISICESLQKRLENDPFLERMVTGDENWFVYNDVTREIIWGHSSDLPLIPWKVGLHPKKIMLFVWWDFKGIIYHELLPSELARRKGVVFHHGNARSHKSLTTQNKLFQLGWDILPHPPYSPDLSPTSYHIFRPLRDSMEEKTFNDEEAIKNHVDWFFANKCQIFYESGITMLETKWQMVIDKNGHCISY